MRKSFLVITSLLLIASFSMGQTVVSIVGSSAQNVAGSDTGYVDVPISMANAAAVGGLQFAIKDVPNLVWVHSINGTDRTSAFSFPFNDTDSTVRVLPFDISGSSIAPGNGPICTIRFGYTTELSDAIAELIFHNILDADPAFHLGITDPDGNPMNATWMNGFLTIGGVEVRLGEGGGGSASFQSVPITVEMNNGVPVKGIQFNVVDGGDYLSIESVVGIDRGANFTFVGNEIDGQSMILGVNFQGLEIPAGSGVIAEVVFNIAAGAPMGDISMSISELIVAAEGGIPLPSNGGETMFSVTVSTDEQAEVPSQYELSQNFPNPFNPTTSISFSVPEASEIHVGIYNLLGQEVRTLTSGEHQPGFYTAMWDGLNKNGTRVESGVYIYRMNTSTGFSATKKLVLLK